MPLLKAYIKKIVYQLRMAGIADTLLYRWQQVKYYKANKQFRQVHPDLLLPADYELYESFQLHYRKFIEEGLLAAQEIAAWTAPFLPTTPIVILDWGCGVARIARHLISLYPNNTIHACDPNANRTAWNQLHYPDIQFSTIGHSPPTPYRSAFFDLIYGISVLTHISARDQVQWIKELHRLLRPRGILLISTQGSYYQHQLLPGDQQLLKQTGAFSTSHQKQGHRMMSTYNLAGSLRSILEEDFIVLEFYDGATHSDKLGGQDLWILQKR